MAVIKYSSSFYLQPVINPPVPGFMETLGRRAQPFDFDFFFVKGTLITSTLHLNVLADGHFV